MHQLNAVKLIFIFIFFTPNFVLIMTRKGTWRGLYLKLMDEDDKKTKAALISNKAPSLSSEKNNEITFMLFAL